MMPAVAIFLLGCLLVAPAVAKEVKVGATLLVLPSPPGYCELDSAQAADTRVVSAIEGMLAPSGNRLLAVSADCEQLAKFRTTPDSLLDNMAQYQTRVSWESRPLSGSPEGIIKQVCEEMRQQGNKLTADMTPDVKARAEQVLKTVTVNEMRFLGVVGEEPLVCYAAMLQKLKTEIGTEKTQLNMFATTFIKSKLIYLYLLAPYVGGDTATSMLEQQRANIAKLRAANR
jgi:hypothetical protein